MKHRVIQEESEGSSSHSLSLGDNTVIQQYNLDYSDEFEDCPSSEEQSISRQNIQQMNKIEEINRIKNKKQAQMQKKLKNNQKNCMESFIRHSKDIENKYDFAISPSTKQEYSLLNPKLREERHSYRNQLNSQSNKQDMDIHLYEQKEQQHQKMGYFDRQTPQSDKARGRESVKAKATQNISKFNIDNFLNAQPLPVKSKKGLSILNEHKENNVKAKYKIKQQPIIEEETIMLVTLPINQDNAIDDQILAKAIKKNQEQLYKINLNYDRKFKETRLNFINTFMPQSLKMKNNAYNMLKYINSKRFA